MALIAGICLLSAASSYAQKKPKPVPPIAFAQGRLQYVPDSLGNRIPDFSYSGYKAGEAAIPDVAVKVVVPLQSGDATRRIQAAIDYVSKLPLSKEGRRGAVLLQPGNYEVDGSLLLHTPGVVLRGSGFAAGGTIITGTGKGRETLIRIEGKDDKVLLDSTTITDDYAPVNARTLKVAADKGLHTGDLVVITRSGTQAWITDLGTDHFGGGITSLGWKPGQRNISWIRTITNTSNSTISIDAPITTAIEKKYGYATLATFSWPGRIHNCGIENLQLVSTFAAANPKDEDHRWMGITMDNVRDAWVRQVTFSHFAGSAVALYENAARITVEDCISLNPISEIGGERRNTFFTAGQQTLFQRCYAENGIHDFVTGFCAPGPNAFVQCESSRPFSFSGGLDSWASGVLFDVVYVDGNAISMLNRGQDGQGAGWNMANSVLWNCSAARIDCYAPPSAQNWALGSWSQFAGNGYWGESNNSIEPRSLYYQQLKERIGVDDISRQLMLIETDASSSPSAATAAQLTAAATTPAKTLKSFIYEAARRNPISVKATGIKAIDQLVTIPAKVTPAATNAIHLQYGWLVSNNAVAGGRRISVPWWNGNARVYARQAAGPAITRFVPGRTGRGWTDDLTSLVDTMQLRNTIAVEQNYGLWYDRRRDDHERIRRMDGDVWAPFYELPFARTGRDTAWDGLSKYDLSTYNHWYWSRLKQYADLADQRGLLLVHQMYFQHNIIEAGAHYADFPWRTANNINDAGFPEPVPYAGDKRIFMAEQFYDTTHPVRRNLHQQYIRQCLNNFAANTGVIQLIGEEFTGPLHFVQFWLNTIRSWEAEKNKRPLIGLSTTGDVQDAILNDPAYNRLIDVIDIRYWYYQANGTAYTPQGGQNLAPRQHARLLKPKSTSAEQVYRAVLEYKLKFPDKAVIYSADAADKFGWAVLMAGGSLPALPATDKRFLQAAAVMQPVATTDGQWVLAGEAGSIIYTANSSVSADLSTQSGRYNIYWINTNTGELQSPKETVQAGKIIQLNKPANGNWALWLEKK
ncbi:pectate lyase [Chitinophaga sp. sic0106]|nr:pectate lyase [Chitinophaga sp. sic0106]